MDNIQLESGLRSFNLHSSQSLSNGETLPRHMTLRNACVDYRDAGGISWVKSQMPESSGTTSNEQVPCLNVFSNSVGHVYEGNITCYPCEDVCPCQSCYSTLRALYPGP